uniref:BESS domain-containing protein n=1 Tax=Trichogramma kaykai TaxID=54128 RepID=A0ABD2WDS8_9HYME
MPRLKKKALTETQNISVIEQVRLNKILYDDKEHKFTSSKEKSKTLKNIANESVGERIDASADELVGEPVDAPLEESVYEPVRDPVDASVYAEAHDPINIVHREPGKVKVEMQAQQWRRIDADVSRAEIMDDYYEDKIYFDSLLTHMQRVAKKDNLALRNRINQVIAE